MSPKSRGHFAHAQTVCTRPSFCGLVVRLVYSLNITTYSLHVHDVTIKIHMTTHWLLECGQQGERELGMESGKWRCGGACALHNTLTLGMRSRKGRGSWQWRVGSGGVRVQVHCTTHWLLECGQQGERELAMKCGGVRVMSWSNVYQPCPPIHIHRGSPAAGHRRQPDSRTPVSEFLPQIYMYMHH